jgi:hypothetical protein
VGTVIQEQHQGNEERHQRWERLERADLATPYRDLHAQGLSQRQAAQGLEVPRSPLQAWWGGPRAPRCVSSGRGVFSQAAWSRLPASTGAGAPRGMYGSRSMYRRLSKAKIGVYGNESASKMHASLHIMGSETVRR